MQTIERHTTQGSGAPAPISSAPKVDLSLGFNCLDRTVDRYELLLLARRVGKEGGFTPRMLQLLDYYLAYTTAKDWEEGSRPIVFQSLARTAMDLGVGERQIQKLEKRLFEIGAICWNDSGNHKRFGRRDPKTGRLVFAYGADLTPLAYLQEELEAKLYEKQLYAEAWRATKREISQHRRQVRELLSTLREEGADGDQLDSFEGAYREIAVELRSHIDLSRLRSLLKDHQSLLQALQQAWSGTTVKESSQLTTSLPIAPPTRARSCSHAQKFAHKEHTTPVNKNRKQVNVAASAKHQNFTDITANWAIGTMTPREVAIGASDGFRAYLPPCLEAIAWPDVIEAAYRRRVDLRIPQQDWADACQALGRASAAACIAITDSFCDRRKWHPAAPVSYFRGVVRRSSGN